jgi:hypothetical protein
MYTPLPFLWTESALFVEVCTCMNSVAKRLCDIVCTNGPCSPAAAVQAGPSHIPTGTTRAYTLALLWLTVTSLWGSDESDGALYPLGSGEGPELRNLRFSAQISPIVRLMQQLFVSEERAQVAEAAMQL